MLSMFLQRSNSPFSAVGVSQWECPDRPMFAGSECLAEVQRVQSGAAKITGELLGELITGSLAFNYNVKCFTLQQCRSLLHPHGNYDNFHEHVTHNTTQQHTRPCQSAYSHSMSVHCLTSRRQHRAPQQASH